MFVGALFNTAYTDTKVTNSIYMGTSSSVIHVGRAIMMAGHHATRKFFSPISRKKVSLFLKEMQKAFFLVGRRSVAGKVLPNEALQPAASLRHRRS